MGLLFRIVLGKVVIVDTFCCVFMLQRQVFASTRYYIVLLYCVMLFLRWTNGPSHSLYFVHCFVRSLYLFCLWYMWGCCVASRYKQFISVVASCVEDS